MGSEKFTTVEYSDIISILIFFSCTHVIIIRLMSGRSQKWSKIHLNEHTTYQVISTYVILEYISKKCQEIYREILKLKNRI